MSRIIAPGKWNQLDRRVARVGSFAVGLVLLSIAYRLGMPLVEAVQTGRDITVWSALLVLVPLAFGCAAVIPNVMVPIIYRAIDKFMRDSPES